MLWVLFAASSRTQGSHDELNELWPLFSFVGESVDGIGFSPSCVAWVVFVATVFCHRLWSIDSVQLTKALALGKISPTLTHCSCFLHVLTCFRQNKLEQKKGMRNAFDVSQDQLVVSDMPQCS